MGNEKLLLQSAPCSKSLKLRWVLVRNLEHEKKACFGQNPENKNAMYFTIWEKRLNGETWEMKDVNRIN